MGGLGLYAKGVEMANKPKIPKLPELTVEEIKKLMAEADRKVKEKIDRWENKIPPESRVGECKVCKGKVTETFSKKYDPSTGPMIIGPGSKGQFFWRSSGLGCEDCGIAYKKLPK